MLAALSVELMFYRKRWRGVGVFAKEGGGGRGGGGGGGGGGRGGRGGGVSSCCVEELCFYVVRRRSMVIVVFFSVAGELLNSPVKNYFTSIENYFPNLVENFY